MRCREGSWRDVSNVCDDTHAIAKAQKNRAGARVEIVNKLRGRSGGGGGAILGPAYDSGFAGALTAARRPLLHIYKSSVIAICYA